MKYPKRKLLNKTSNKLRLIHLGIDPTREYIVYLHPDCSVSKKEGFEADSQVLVANHNRSIIATLHFIHSDLLAKDEVSLSAEAWKQLASEEGDFIELTHPKPVSSLKYIRGKMFGEELNESQINEVVFDIASGKYTKVHLASFITACAQNNFNEHEILYLTQAFIQTGTRLQWDDPIIVDKHSVGGIPGNCISPIVVSIVAASGLMIPKTSSRAITSPAGTADVAETVTRVDLSASEIKRVVNKEGGCMAWGSALGFSVADDRLIHIERMLRIDPIGPMVASVLSKKIGIGATHVVIDIPVGPTAKIRSDSTFELIERYFAFVAKMLGLQVYVIKTDGNQPIGKGIGPALEMKDILAILNNEKNLHLDLKNKALQFASILLEAGGIEEGNGILEAKVLLESGKALQKFMAICEAQGGFHEPPTADYTYDIVANQAGRIEFINNRELSLIAKLAGAPQHPAAGVEFLVQKNSDVQKNQPIYRIHAETKGELDYAVPYAKSVPVVTWA
ncbi:thymidine/pyrimidine-nucleoside phosphorylase [Legionella lansingensis]|uniref:thymidine phosphorylase n=1 Tax=Legionella lansingensis TaxID=45067 RepID=A0A0W0VK08_9GAMM|nr:thymidine phosphorylase family protein [Legionella lansingensis]KTD20443.1 thymidine/pyrimidine-nucleoside phosphorylase [Legionella lansingensis]SNV49936.1 thymidine/pyrimidine-nucleoside phosphorylase [Legionella lansingensis]